jgi:hypothetical protein
MNPTTPARYVTAGGLTIERPTTRREAGDELARRALRRFRAGEFSTVREALHAAMADDPILTRVYATQ